MGKMIQADSFHGQTMFLNWRGYHSSTGNGVFYDSGWTTTFTYPYTTIIPPFKGCINKVSLTNNPYSSYQSGPTGSSATLRVIINGVYGPAFSTVNYTAGTAGEVITFDFGDVVEFNANDRVKLEFQANGIWRYYNLGIQLMELA